MERKRKSTAMGPSHLCQIQMLVEGSKGSLKRQQGKVTKSGLVWSLKSPRRRTAFDSPLELRQILSLIIRGQAETPIRISRLASPELVSVENR